jgi:predicted MFS family arabinose efflux permease
VANRPVATALGGMLALASAMGIGRFVYTPILPAMVGELGLSQAQAGLIASANFVGYLLGALLAAAPRLPGSRRAWLLGGLLLGAGTTAAMAVVSSFVAFLGLRFVGGVASAFVLVFASALVLDCLAAVGRSGLSAVHFAGVGVGIALSAVLVAALRSSGADWRTLWLAAGAASLAAAVAVAWLLPAGTASAASARPAANPGPQMILWATAYGLFGFGYVVTATFLVAIVRADPTLGPVEPFIWLVVGLAGAPSIAAWNRIGARWGIARALALACLLEAIGVAASVLWPSVAGELLAAFLLGGTFMGITALGLAGGRLLAAGDPRRLLAVLTAAFGVGQIIGPTVAGLLRDWTGSFLLPSLLAATALVAAALLALRVPIR